ncbi:MAG: hypothetical protein N2Z60_01260 [Elusimicrobiales bacterium]|jgi:predicted nucleic acid-binding Zn ribbon protein|nr:hypothetical protein [Elusimicrobiales bacterium]
MKKYKLEDLKEIPLSENFISEQKREILQKTSSNREFKFKKYALPSLAAAALLVILFLKKPQQPKPIYPEDSLYFYQSMDMLEYMDVLESVSEEELK